MLEVTLQVIRRRTRWSSNTILIKSCYYVGTIFILATADYHQAIICEVTKTTDNSYP